jgi:ERCC4-type nuclease
MQADVKTGHETSVDITVDTRERGRIVKALEALPGVRLDFAELDCGDYLLANGVAIERKSSTDFILSIVDRSLFEKVARLKARYARPLYIVEGDMFTMRFHQKAFDVHTALAYLSVTHQVPVVNSPDVEQTAMLIYLMAAEAQRDPAQRPDARLDKPSVRTEAQRYLVEGLPGIDADRAEELLRRFGTAERIFAADEAALQSQGALSPELARRIREVVEATWPGAAG